MSPENQASGASGKLSELSVRASACELCPQLVESRSQVVFGTGPADARLMLVGEAPGASEDREGVPFVGASGRLLNELLEGIGLAREQVFIANVLKCRPPQNRDPKPEEVANCSPWLERQLEIIDPAVVVTLGNFATRLLRGDTAPIGRVRGQVEICGVGDRLVRLLPVFHPAAALYRRPNLEVLQADFALIPALVEMGPPDQAAAAAASGGGGPREPTVSGPAGADRPVKDDGSDQLGLF